MRDLRITLVDPGMGQKSFGTFGSSHWSSINHEGLCSLSASAKRCGFKDIGLVDIRKLRGWNQFKRGIAIRKPDVVGLTMRSCDYNFVTKAIEIVKTTAEDIIVVVGGIHPTVATAEVARDERIDYIITGEGEISFTGLLKSLSVGARADRLIKGAAPDLDSLPFEDRELYDYKVTIRRPNYPGIFKSPMITLLAGRGCLYNCSFCQPAGRMLFGKERRRSVDNVIEEMTLLKERYNFNSFKFYDYSFISDPRWVEEFCAKYERHSFKADFLCQARSDQISRNERLIKALSDIGLKLIIVGFESGSQRILDFLKKGTKVEENLEAASICKRRGVKVVANIMIGVPTETRDEVRETVSMVRKMKPDIVSISYYTPIPGSRLADYCAKNNLSLLKSHDDYVTAPDRPKIRGVDYKVLKDAVDEMMAVNFKSRLLGKIARFFYVKTKRFLGLRNFLVFCYTRWKR